MAFQALNGAFRSAEKEISTVLCVPPPDSVDTDGVSATPAGALPGVDGGEYPLPMSSELSSVGL